MDCVPAAFTPFCVPSAFTHFLIVQEIIFAELLLDQHLIIFVCVNEMILIYNDS